jgi:hypothetical protein
MRRGLHFLQPLPARILNTSILGVGVRGWRRGGFPLDFVEPRICNDIDRLDAWQLNEIVIMRSTLKEKFYS